MFGLPHTPPNPSSSSFIKMDTAGEPSKTRRESHACSALATDPPRRYFSRLKLSSLLKKVTVNCRAKKSLIVLPSRQLPSALCASHNEAVEKGSPVVSKWRENHNVTPCSVNLPSVFAGQHVVSIRVDPGVSVLAREGLNDGGRSCFHSVSFLK
jgi:hypothetical protein